MAPTSTIYHIIVLTLVQSTLHCVERRLVDIVEAPERDHSRFACRHEREIGDEVEHRSGVHFLAIFAVRRHNEEVGHATERSYGEQVAPEGRLVVDGSRVHHDRLEALEVVQGGVRR